MFRRSNLEVPDTCKKTFFDSIYIESVIRVRAVLVVLMLLQTFQMCLYIFSGSKSLHDGELIYLKLFIILFSLVSYFLLMAAEKDKKPLSKFRPMILCLVISLILLWSVINTFKAQSISSDISVYLLVLFAISAVVRVHPWITSVIFASNYIVFLIGIPFFQKNVEYRTAHIMNGLILNIIALLIAHMMYRYSLIDFLDKRSIEMKNSELLHLARHDGLTSLYNHQAIHELLETSIQRVEDTSEPLTIMLLDLDYFKEINDILGHRAGDSALKTVSQCILHNIRQEDMAGRYGGDEFLIVLPGSNISNTNEIAHRLLAEIRNLNFEGIKLSFSCGIALWRGQKTDQLIDEADKALYRVKNDGRNNIYA